MKKYYQQLKKILRERTTGAIILLLVLLVFIIFLWQRIFITILPGEAGVRWSRFGGGTQVDYVYPEGMHYIYPWDKMYIYNVRVQQRAHQFDVLTKNGLKLTLYISIRYKPEYKLLGLLHQQVGPDYVEKVVIPEIEAVLRILIGQGRAEEIYASEQQAIIEKSLNEAIEQVAQRYVNVDDVIIKRVVFPPFVANAIERKIEQKQLAEAHQFRIEREERERTRKLIEADAFKQYNEILAASLSDQILQWKGIQATLELASSTNAKVIVIGGGKDGLPIIGNIPIESLSPREILQSPPTTGGADITTEISAPTTNDTSGEPGEIDTLDTTVSETPNNVTSSDENP